MKRNRKSSLRCATTAHTHVGAKGAKDAKGAKGENGPVIRTAIKTTDTVCSVPHDAKLSVQQLVSYGAGRLNVHVHTGANSDGELSAQLAA